MVVAVDVEALDRLTGLVTVGWWKDCVACSHLLVSIARTVLAMST